MEFAVTGRCTVYLLAPLFKQIWLTQGLYKVDTVCSCPNRFGWYKVDTRLKHSVLVLIELVTALGFRLIHG